MLALDRPEITNTTLSRDGLVTRGARALGAGGVSGKPLADAATKIIRMIYGLSNGRLPIIGVGGIFTGKTHLQRLLPELRCCRRTQDSSMPAPHSRQR